MKKQTHKKCIFVYGISHNCHRHSIVLPLSAESALCTQTFLELSRWWGCEFLCETRIIPNTSISSYLVFHSCDGFVDKLNLVHVISFQFVRQIFCCCLLSFSLFLFSHSFWCGIGCDFTIRRSSEYRNMFPVNHTLFGIIFNIPFVEMRSEDSYTLDCRLFGRFCVKQKEEKIASASNDKKEEEKKIVLVKNEKLTNNVLESLFRWMVILSVDMRIWMKGSSCIVQCTWNQRFQSRKRLFNDTESKRRVVHSVMHI